MIGILNKYLIFEVINQMICLNNLSMTPNYVVIIIYCKNPMETT